MTKFCVATLIVVGTVAGAGTAQAQVQSAEVTGGKLQGVVASGIASFEGVPFAAAPVGENRWRSPQPVVPWTGVKMANAMAPACLQDTRMAARLGAPTAVSEDCLYLNIWTPAKTPRDKLPVMVWVYGGAFVGGATNWPLYDGTHFAGRGVVLVSVAYRVGAFGFLAHPELSEESGKGSGNYGLEDQIAGLKWVKANIAKFGGDPGRVTIFGESAGGISVSMLAASPAARGLFQRAISESGGSFAPARYANEGGENVPPLKVAEAHGEAFLAKLGAFHISAARTLPAEVLRKALGPGLAGGFWPVFDGDVLPGDQYELYQSGRFNDTPVLIGTNSNEGGLFVRNAVTPAQFESQVRAGFGAKADEIVAAYPHASDAESLAAMKGVFRESTFAWHTWAWALLQSQKGKGKAYVYYFDHRTPQSPEGSDHGSELAYVFGTLGGPGLGPAGPSGPPRPEDTAMSELMMSYWVNFATRGDPNGRGLPAWPAFGAAAQQAMILKDTSPGAGPVPNLGPIKAFDDYYAWRREQAKSRPAE